MGRKAARSAAEKLKFIEGMRGIAALYVVLGHICSLADPGVFLGVRGTGPEWLRIAMQPFGFGHLAVAAFIVISGFCLQTSLFNRGDGSIKEPKKFFKRRALRILPPYYACLAISLVVALYVTPLGHGLPFSLYLPVTPNVVLSHLFLVHNWSPDWMYKINGVLWSIAIEAQLYLLFPLLVWLLNKANRLATVLSTLAVTAAILTVTPRAEKFYPWYLALFTIGMAASHLAFSPPKWRGPNALAAMLFGGLSLGMCVWSATKGFSMPVLDSWLGACVVSVIYACTVSKNFTVGKFLSAKPLAWLGAVSYSLYLMHHPILQPLYLFRPKWAAGPLEATLYLSGVGLPVVFLGVVAFWFIFERPFISRPNKKPALKQLKRAVVLMPGQIETAPVPEPIRETLKR